MADDTSSLINVDRLTTYHGLITKYIDDKTAIGDNAITEVNELIQDTSASAKRLLANSIANKGVAVDNTATFAEMAEAIDNIDTDSGNATGNATVSQVLAGATFSNGTAVGLTGTMKNNGAVTQALNCGGSYTIPEGYHNGSGTVTGVTGGGNYTLQSKEVTPTKN